MNKTVASKLTNGFGNNIFQSVAGRLLAEHHGAYFFAIPPDINYYAIKCLQENNVIFKTQPLDGRIQYVTDDNYLQSFKIKEEITSYILSGYFEDYEYYYNNLDKIRSWFPKIEQRQDKDLVIHMRTGDRLFMKNEFYTKPTIDNYLRAIDQFDFDRLHIVTDMPKWDYVTKDELSNMKFHLHVEEDRRVPIEESVNYFNSFVEGFKKYDPIMVRRSISEDFRFIRSFKNILFEHGTLGWWAAVLSDAQKVGVYGPWRPWKGKKNKNLSQIPLDTWFKWE